MLQIESSLVSILLFQCRARIIRIIMYYRWYIAHGCVLFDRRWFYEQCSFLLEVIFFISLLETTKHSGRAL
jgi:hypothetical protein